MTTDTIIEIVASVILLTLFIVGLRKYLRGGSTNRGAAIPALTLCFLLCIYLVLKGREIEPADWAQIMLLFSLVVVTGVYTHASVKMAEEVRQQRLNASQAVIWPVVWWMRDAYLEITLNNIGNAPALKVKVFLQDKLIITGRSHIPQGDRSHIPQGDKMVVLCLEGGEALAHEGAGSVGGKEKRLKRLAGLVDSYPLRVTWDDLLEQQFEATLLFSLKVDSEGQMVLEILEEPKLRKIR